MAKEGKKFLADDELKNLVRGAIPDALTLNKAVGNVRKHISFQQIIPFHEWLSQFPKAREALLPKALWTNFHSRPEFPVLGFLEEVQWAVCVLEPHLPKLKKFCAARAHLAARFISGGYTANLLLEIEEEFGPSLWLIETQLALRQAHGGIESQKAFVKEMQERARRSFSDFLSYYISERNEASVTLLGFRNRLARARADWRVAEDFSIYLMYRLALDIPSTREGLAHLLRFEQRSTAVDLYITLVDVVHAAAFLLESELEQSERLFKIVQPLTAINDPILGKLLLLARPDSSDNTTKARSLNGINAFLASDFRGARKLAAKQMRASPLDATSLLEFVEACAAMESAPKKDEIGQFVHPHALNLFRVLSKDSAAESAAAQVRKEAANLRCLYIGHALAGPVELRMSAESGDRLRQIRQGLLASPLLDIRDIHATRRDGAGIPIGLLSRFPDCAASSVEQFISDGDAERTRHWVSDEQSIVAKMHRHFQQADWEAATRTARELQQSKILVLSTDAKLVEVRCRLSAGEVLEGLNLMVCAGLEHPTLVQFLPFDELFEGREWRDYRQFVEYIELPIAFDLYWKLRHRNEHLRARRIAWRQFLRHHKVRVPSELIPISQKFDQRLLSYFLEHVCVPDVMDISTAFRTPADLDQERAKICVELATMHPKRRADFDAEVIEITKRRRIESGLRDIDSSRLYVDATSLALWAERELTEDFKRYLEHKQAGVASTDEDFVKVLYELMQSAAQTRAGELPTPLLEPAEKILFQLAYIVCDAFLVHPMYGLDRFLSMRVRHGSFAGRLRGPAQEHNLLATYDEQSKIYHPQQHWLEQLKDHAQRKTVLDAIANFSRKFDSALDAFISKKLQVRSINNPEGAFDILVPPIWVANLRKFFSSESTLEDFVSHCFQAICFPQTQVCLQALRQNLHEHLGASLRQALNELQNEIELALTGDEMEDIIVAVNKTRIELQEALTNVESWFYFSQDPDSGTLDYDIAHAIDVAHEATRITHHGFAPSLAADISPSVSGQLAPYIFRWITDALFIIFGNIYQHSRIPNGKPRVDIQVSGDSVRGLRLRVASEVQPGTRNRRTEERLAEIREAITSGEYLRYTRKEGGSGLIKLRALCVSTKETPNPVEFGFIDDEHFFVEVASSAVLIHVLSAPAAVAQ